MLLIVAGDQVPTTPFGDVVAKIGAAVPEQIAGIAPKLEVNAGVTVTDMV